MSKTVFSIGVTGGIACGKSVVGQILENFGVSVCDADCVAHRQMMPGQVVFNQIVNEFGKDVLGSDGMINRDSLSQIVFRAPAALQRLNAIAHPPVRCSIESWILEQGGMCAVLVPLLYEVGWEKMWDVVVCVAASEKNMLTRLNGRGLTDAESHRRIAAQMKLDEKISRADYVIYNNGTLAELEKSVRSVIDRIKCERMQ